MRLLEQTAMNYDESKKKQSFWPHYCASYKGARIAIIVRERNMYVPAFTNAAAEVFGLRDAEEVYVEYVSFKPIYR